MTSVAAVPASFAQERFWVAEQLAGAYAHHVHLAVRLDGPLDVAAFAAAVRRAAQRHEALRTTLRPIDGRPHQVIAERLTLPTAVVETPTTVRLDLAAGPVVHSEVVRLGPDRHLWLLTAHHAVCDGWSLGVLLEEVGAAYRGEPLTPPPLQYADYAVWQRAVAEQGVFDEGLGRWAGTLDGAPATLDLPTDRARPVTRAFRGALLPLPDLPAGLDELARAERVTPFAAALAAFALLLHRLTGAEDLVIGTTHAGRDRPETQRLVGCVANTLPLRVRADSQRGFRDLLRRAGEAVVAAHDHAEVPFDRIVQVVNPEREPGRHPIFQVMLDAEPPAATRLCLPGVTATPLPASDRGVALFDLSLTLGRDGGLVCEYDTALFDEETARSYTAALNVLAEAAVADPDAPIGELPARERLLVTAGPVDARLVPELIEAASRRRPEAYAVGDLTWRQFAARAAWVRARLGERGVGRGDVVALLADRSPETIAWIHGIHRAGAAYLPLDPALPDARIAILLTRAAPAALITSDTQATRAATLLTSPAPAGDLTHPHPPNTPRTAHAPKPEQTPHGLGAGGLGALLGEPIVPGGRVGEAGDGVSIDGDDLAYVMFTSGSTGEPKAVEVTHGGLAAYVAAHLELYGLTSEDRVLQSASLSFDLSAEEIFPCLAAGATLVPRTAGMLEGPQAFLDGLRRLGVTVAHLPTSLLPATPGPSPLRLVVIGSEPADPARVAGWARAEGVRLAHVYGVTEAGMVSTVAFVDAVPERSRLSIGHPIAGTEVHVLDRALLPVPDGVPGEVYLGGAGLARGYRGDPARTASRFVPHPSGGGRRLYRTGDLARRRPDGSLEYVGRLDRQLSLRGFRIDPLEPEAVLRRHPAVADAAVTVRGEALVGYAVPRGAAVPVEELRAHLALELPPYLVPGAFVWLDELPRTGSGKIDTAALPRPAARPGPEPLSGAAQQAVAEIWRDVLGVGEVGADDDFFQLGGHSLLAGQVAARLRRRFGAPVAMTVIFRHPRLADLAAAIERLAGSDRGSPLAGRARDAAQALQSAVGDPDELAALLRDVGVSRD